MTLAITTVPFRDLENRGLFDTGNVTVSAEAWFALGQCCGNAYFALLTAHVRNAKLRMTSDELHRLNAVAIDGDGDQVITLGRLGSGDTFQVTTVNLHTQPETFIDLVIQEES